ncbi:MAG: hypothetical protein H7Y37_18960 [Anaerolineae bacterium]|nr:hypothetical protein [Gloeobacterales cyanobacterium ES-bin-313]
MDQQLMIWFVLAGWMMYLFVLCRSAPSKTHLGSRKLMRYDYRRWLRILKKRTDDAPKIPEGPHKLHHYYILSPELLVRHKR